MTPEHKVLNYLEHLWPYISGIVVTMAAGIRLWWYDRKETKDRIKHLEILAQNSVTKSELHSCREDVRDEDEENLTRVLGEIKEMSVENQRQHEDIMKQIIELYKK